MIWIVFLSQSSCAVCGMISNADANISTLNSKEVESIVHSSSVAVCDMITTSSFNYSTNGGLLVCNYGGLPIQKDPNATLPSPISRGLGVRIEACLCLCAFVSLCLCVSASVLRGTGIFFELCFSAIGCVCVYLCSFFFPLFFCVTPFPCMFMYVRVFRGLVGACVCVCESVCVCVCVCHQLNV